MLQPLFKLCATDLLWPASNSHSRQKQVRERGSPVNECPIKKILLEFNNYSVKWSPKWRTSDKTLYWSKQWTRERVLCRFI